ncbi:unnamed protein product [Polarella glacialis]|uniref:Uncharacterized protein n=1 Tax=Polarella glacialis TaxID=89957 RepID=A0A813EDH3_POLGL|nr:unnamed protein product [Polarella glacialis]CAE8600164.1 unnamed protein product [Polarella glacialis]
MPVEDADIARTCPGTFVFRVKKEGAVYVTMPFLVLVLSILYETLSFKPAQRRMLDLYMALLLVSMSPTSSHMVMLLFSVLQYFPSAVALAHIARCAFSPLIKTRVRQLRKLQFVYNGQGLRLDGNVKRAKVIVRFLPPEPGMKRKLHRPFTCLLGFCGTDGSLLQPVVPLRGECWDDMEPVLETLLRDSVAARLQAGMSLEEAIPVFISTDSYSKHRLLLKKLVCKVVDHFRVQTVASTPRGPVSAVKILGPEENPAYDLVTIAGEPFHDVINYRKCVSPQCNDSVDGILDHTDLLMRLNAEELPFSAAREAQQADVPELGPAGKTLLQIGVQRTVADFKAALLADHDGASDLRVFLSSAGVRRARAVWMEVFKAQPPRPVIARLARRAQASLHRSCAYFNYPDQAAFLAETRCMQKWYQAGRKLTRRRRGLLRVRAGAAEHVRGRQCIWNAKLKNHYRLLRKDLRLEGLWAWRRCALALHRAHLNVQSGTLPVERFWSFLGSIFPPQQRALKECTFELLADLAFMRYTWTHYNRPAQAAWTRRDPLLAHRFTEFGSLMKAASIGESTGLEAEIAAACKTS